MNRNMFKLKWSIGFDSCVSTSCGEFSLWVCGSCQFLLTLVFARADRCFRCCRHVLELSTLFSGKTLELLKWYIYETKASGKSESGQISRYCLIVSSVTRVKHIGVLRAQKLAHGVSAAGPWMRRTSTCGLWASSNWPCTESSELGLTPCSAKWAKCEAIIIVLMTAIQMPHDAFCIILHNLASFARGSCKYSGRILAGFIVSEMSHLSLAPEPGVIDANLQVLATTSC